MEDHASAPEIQKIVEDLLPEHGATQLVVKRSLAKCLIAAFCRRVFRSHPELWDYLRFRLLRSLQKRVVDGKDEAATREWVRDAAKEFDLPMSSLYGAGQH